MLAFFKLEKLEKKSEIRLIREIRGYKKQIKRNRAYQLLICSILFGVEGGTRTHDIQNHNLTL